MKSIDSFGFLEIFGLAAAIEAADAMLKSAQVRLVRQHELNPGLITLVVEGDLASCRAAINAGKAAAARVGMVVGSHVIGRPDKDTESMILKYIPESNDEPKSVKKSEKSAKPQKAASASSSSSPSPSAKAVTPVKAAAPVTQAVPAKAVEPSQAVQAEVLKKAVAAVKVVEAPKKEVVATPKDLNSSVAVTKPVEKAVVEKSAAPVVPAKKVVTQAEFEKVIAYITSVAKGRSWKEIKIHFPLDPEQLLKKLNEAVTSGRLAKAGANYRKVENKRS